MKRSRTEAKNNYIKIYLRQGQCLQAQKAVLALGNPPNRYKRAFARAEGMAHRTLLVKIAPILKMLGLVMQRALP